MQQLHRHSGQGKHQATRRVWSGVAIGLRWRGLLALSLVASLLTSGCFETEKGEPFYGRVAVPAAQEFRWSDGGLPRVFDPALAAAPPDTDAVRALFEGLTDYDPQTLKPVEAVAVRWEASTDARLWTFYLRRDARWSNGDTVTARDFVRSWQRTLRLGDRSPHARLLENIEGAQSAVALVTDSTPESSVQTPAATPQTTPERNAPASRTPPVTTPTPQARPAPQPKATVFGAEAVGDFVLKVRLRRPDKNFPALVAHPVFRPVHEVEANKTALSPQLSSAEGTAPAAPVISNGAFLLSGQTPDSVVLHRASSYWDAAKVSLDRVRFVGTRDAEAALAAYRNGDVDAVTNAAFEPLALKLLAPYKDFRRTTYGALTYYSFNLNRRPFSDRRVREALAIALDRARLSADTMKGATEPAERFLPLVADEEEESRAEPPESPDAQGERAEAVETPSEKQDAKQDAPAPGSGTERAEGEAEQSVATETDEAAQAEEQSEPAQSSDTEPGEGGEETAEEARPLVRNVERARQLLAEAGFPRGENFPRIRLLVNRNDQQRVMAQAIAAQWRSLLGVETELVVRDWEDYEAALWTGEYDIARRGMVMQTTDEESNMLALFERENRIQAVAATESTPATTPEATPQAEDELAGQSLSALLPHARPVLTEAEALRELPAFPVYFASSYALVKPYVSGFHSNLLDAPSLKHVRLDASWKSPEEKTLIRVVRNR